jgi:hypothetical protein
MWPNQGVIAFDPHSGVKVLSKLRCAPDVQRAHKTSGRFDMRLESEAQKTAELNRILD